MSSTTVAPVSCPYEGHAVLSRIIFLDHLCIHATTQNIHDMLDTYIGFGKVRFVNLSAPYVDEHSKHRTCRAVVLLDSADDAAACVAAEKNERVTRTLLSRCRHVPAFIASPKQQKSADDGAPQQDALRGKLAMLNIGVGRTYREWWLVGVKSYASCGDDERIADRPSPATHFMDRVFFECVTHERAKMRRLEKKVESIIAVIGVEKPKSIMPLLFPHSRGKETRTKFVVVRTENEGDALALKLLCDGYVQQVVCDDLAQHDVTLSVYYATVPKRAWRRTTCGKVIDALADCTLGKPTKSYAIIDDEHGDTVGAKTLTWGAAKNSDDDEEEAKTGRFSILVVEKRVQIVAPGVAAGTSMMSGDPRLKLWLRGHLGAYLPPPEALLEEE